MPSGRQGWEKRLMVIRKKLIVIEVDKVSFFMMTIFLLLVVGC